MSDILHGFLVGLGVGLAIGVMIAVISTIVGVNRAIKQADAPTNMDIKSSKGD